ncbi:MAG: hypothetical protein SFX73_36850 [Kofleriaceae bacterium]|nr:hypothetical protein [Kofleriaceae bacterium]
MKFSTSVVFASEAKASLLRPALCGPSVFVATRTEFFAACAKKNVVAFVDCDLFLQIEGEVPEVPIIGVMDTAMDALDRSVQWMDAFPWVSHLVVTTLLETPSAADYLATLLQRLPQAPSTDLGVTGVGRVALLARASRRGARLDRMREFFAKHGLSQRALATINDVAEELMTNGLYDAPMEGGYFKQAVPRTEDVELPEDRACEISYGVERDDVFVRLRDTFGSLSRERLLGVLSRCNATSVPLDESRGGAGLGMWRVFSAASTINIAVLPGRLTDIRVTLATKQGRIVKGLHAVHLHFAQIENTLEHLDRDSDLAFEQSITLVA